MEIEENIDHLHLLGTNSIQKVWQSDLLFSNYFIRRRSVLYYKVFIGVSAVALEGSWWEPHGKP